MSAAAITIIELWPRAFTCHRCQMEHFDSLAWAFYEDFIIGPGEWWQESGGYVSVCRCCYLELLAAEAIAPSLQKQPKERTA